MLLNGSPGAHTNVTQRLTPPPMLPPSCCLHPAHTGFIGAPFIGVSQSHSIFNSNKQYISSAAWCVMHELRHERNYVCVMNVVMYVSWMYGVCFFSCVLFACLFFSCDLRMNELRHEMYREFPRTLSEMNVSRIIFHECIFFWMYRVFFSFMNVARISSQKAL